MPRRANPSAMIGRSFGLLTVKTFLGIDNAGRAMYRCVCSCDPSGKQTKDASRPNLVSLSVKSCGCLKYVRRSKADGGQTRYFTKELREARAMVKQPQVPYKIVIHRYSD